MAQVNRELATVRVLWLRQIKTHWRSRARLAMAVFQPLLFLVSFGFGFRGMFASAGRGDFIDFLAPGIVGMGVIFSAMFMGIGVIQDRQFGFLKETLVAPVSRLSIFAGRTLGGATVAVVQGLMVLAVTLLFGFSPASLGGLAAGLVFMFLLAALFTALGTALATFFSDMQAFPLIINLVVMPMFFLSGALFPLDGLPRGLAAALQFNPLAYGVDGLRGSLGGAFHFSGWMDLAVMLACLVAASWIGAQRFRRMEA
jgi:ABC-2 type transport system permease protein